MIAQTPPLPIQMCFEATNLVLTLLDILSWGYVVSLLNTYLQGLKNHKKGCGTGMFFKIFVVMLLQSNEIYVNKLANNRTELAYL